MMSKPCPPRPELDALIEAARNLPPMTPAERRAQAISFVYGNLAIENDYVTREMVEKAYDEQHGPDITAKYARLLSALDCLADPEGTLCGIHPGPELDELQAAYDDVRVKESR